MAGKKKKKRINIKRVLLSLFVLALIVIAPIFGWQQAMKIANGNELANITQVEEVKIPDDTTISIVAIGDVMCHAPNYQAAYNSSTKTYDFTPFFTNVVKYITEGDVAIGNLETTFSGASRGYSGYPQFNSPSELGVAMKQIGVDILSTANNHCMDKGATGVVSTLDALDEIGLDHIGTNRSKEEQDTVLVKEINGIKIAFLSFTYGTNGISVPSDKKYLVNLTDKTL